MMITTNVVYRKYGLFVFVLLSWFFLIRNSQAFSICDLENNSSTRFFNEGREQFEREILIVENNTINVLNPILEINQNVEFNQSYFHAYPLFTNLNYSHELDHNSIINYQFTIELPSNMGENLQSLTIISPNNLPQFDFNLEKTKAWFNQDHNPITINSFYHTMIDQNKAIKVTFLAPIPPNNIITICLQGNRPSNINNGFYNFGIWATPAGENPQDFYLGSRSIVFP